MRRREVRRGTVFGFSGLRPLLLWGAAIWITAFARAGAPTLSEIHLTLAPEALAHLESSPRDLVPARLEWNGTNLPAAQVRLKGSTGSFRPVSDRPGLTVVWEEAPSPAASPTRRSMHLNNSVEDPSRLQEALAVTWFREAGVPAPAVTQARVVLNGRPLGLYVLVEGVDRAFLRRTYPGVPARSFGEDDRIPALEAVRLESNPERRWRKLNQTVDVPECVSYLAVEAIVGHRDGYLAARNNFRLVEQGVIPRLALLPHGMDQVVGPPDFPWDPASGGLLAQLIRTHPEGQRQFEARVRALLAQFGDETAWVARLDRLAAPLLAALRSEEAAEVRPAVEALRERMRARARGVAHQLESMDSASVEALRVGEQRPLTRWTLDLLGGESIAQGDEGGIGRKHWLHARLSGDAAVVWHAALRLNSGLYRVEGTIRTRDLLPMTYGQRHGARLRVAGEPGNFAPLLGTQDWSTRSAEFEIKGASAVQSVPVDILCEVRGRSGEAWFDLKSLRIHRVR